LLDDPVVAIVRHELEDSVFAAASPSEPPKVMIHDLAASRDCKDRPPETYDITEEERIVGPTPEEYFRFGMIELHGDINVLSGRTAAEIGETLWRILNPEAGPGTPTDFLSRHLMASRDWLGVWSRRGIILAVKPTMKHWAKLSKERFDEVVHLARDIDSFSDPGGRSVQELAARGEELTRRAARIRHILALPDNRLMSRFFEAVNLGEFLHALRDLNLTAAEHARQEDMGENTRTIAEVQTKVEWLEIFIVGFYSTELARTVVEHIHRMSDVWKLVAILSVGIVSTLATFLILAPWKQQQSKRTWWFLLLLSVLYVAGFAPLGLG
jgi:hypothetical protein